MRQYVALSYTDAASNHGVSLPGCITAGHSLDEARLLAEEALTLHLDGLADDAGAVPEPSSLEAVMADRETKDGVAALGAAKDEIAKVR